ncbi:bifunctional 3,4-dihydroxy-2-butanone-4-phosphate synthase/GTP cyclohydrolase II [Pokkaliibacter sp. CJK22405]|uniref:bifunctional 3,4-dihydroxy-2-butanone-4-phosphate synthase/GTP cyclohydrolase II n=1 Tax=Pokkaliibacter sp. CJK22405 TaxID=3384615 RepID=UPI003984A067
MAISTAQEIIEDIRQGKMVILMDDEDRENEGDILLAADKVTPEAVNFMAKHGRGLICLTLTQDRCRQLNLPLMVRNNTEAFSTAFTVAIEAATGVETGISAKDRCRTIQVAVAENAVPEDIVMPGHIFPVMAQEGGVLTRAGHTEAGCDVARLAGLTPSCVIVEILNDDGTMARRPELEVFAEKHGIKLGTIADLIAYRYETERTIEKVAETVLETAFGAFNLLTYRDQIEHKLHFALTKGPIDTDGETLVRVHSQDPVVDVLHAGGKKWSIPAAMQRIAEQGGVLVILASQDSEDAVLEKIQRLGGKETKAAAKATRGQFSQIGVGSQILSDLGVRKMRLLTSTEQRYHALSGFGLEVVENICE